MIRWLSAHEAKLSPVLRGLDLGPSESTAMQAHLEVLKLRSSSVTQRSNAAKEIKLAVEAIIKPKLCTYGKPSSADRASPSDFGG